MSCPDPTPPPLTEIEKLRKQAELLQIEAMKLENADYLQSPRFPQDLEDLRSAVGIDRKYWDKSLEVQLKEMAKKARATSNSLSDALWR